MNTKIVLLVDSHPVMLEGIIGLLKTTFESVVMVSDEESLCKALPRLKPDLVIVDESLTVTRNSDVIRLIDKLDPEVKIVALGSYDCSETIKNCMAAGASGFVVKHRAAKELIKALDMVLKGHTFFSQHH